MADKRKHDDSLFRSAVVFDNSLTPLHNYNPDQTIKPTEPNYARLQSVNELAHVNRVSFNDVSAEEDPSLNETSLNDVSPNETWLNGTSLNDSFFDVTLTPTSLKQPTFATSSEYLTEPESDGIVSVDYTLPSDRVAVPDQLQASSKVAVRHPSILPHESTLSPTHPNQEVILLRAHPQLIPEGFTVTICEHIGEGGTAVVNRATQNLLDRNVALKRLKAASKESNSAHFMLKEAQLMARLDHPNIPPIYQIAFDSKGVPLILMKHVKGTSWDVLINDPQHEHWTRHPCDQLRTHLDMLVKICFAVEYAHEKGIIHCDIKSSNVMVGDFGEVFLLDWGLAIELDNVDQQRVKGFYGSPSFAAPEMFTSGAELTRQTDVYLLGATLHQILTQKPLHQGKSLREVVEFARRSLRHDYPESIHPMLVHIIHRATDPDPHKRFATVSEFREALEEHLSHYAMLDMVSEMRDKITELEQLLAQSKCNEFHFYELAFQCRFGFKRALESFPEDLQLKRDLCQVLFCHARYELSQDRLEMPPLLLQEMKVLGAAQEKINALESEIQSAKLRSSELAVQIQYKLLEELQRAKNASSS